MLRNKVLFLSILICIFTTPLFSNETEVEEEDQVIILDIDKLPIIESLKPSRKNVLFAGFQSIVENNNLLVAAGHEPEFMFYKYKNTEDFTFQGLAARLCINQDTIATLNGISSSQDDINGRTLIIPTVNGLYIPINNISNKLEQLLHDNYKEQTLTNKELCFRINEKEYLFLQNKRMSPTERAYFLDSSLRLPLDIGTYWVSSEFGKRKNPLSGQIKNHNGIDLAAPVGTPVYAIKDGSAYCCIYGDKELGNYIILSHDMGKMTSVYAHLSKICIEQYQNVRKGDIIGYVGETGMATGPHLHFEIRQGGVAQDPRTKLNLDN